MRPRGPVRTTQQRHGPGITHYPAGWPFRLPEHFHIRRYDGERVASDLPPAGHFTESSFTFNTWCMAIFIVWLFIFPFTLMGIVSNIVRS